MRVFQYKSKNVGDTLTEHIIKHFLNCDVELVNVDDKNKLVGVGSIVYAVKEGDIVFGTGLIEEVKTKLPPCEILALRGKLTAKLINSDCKVFGDPAILLPRMYNPDIPKKNKIGIVEHYVDKSLYKGKGHRINVKLNWKKFINEIKSCEKIISSSLHGCIIAEAYGIPTKWIKLSDKVIGGGFKFRDYLSATDRTSFSQRLTKKKLSEQQNKLIGVLKSKFKK